MSRIRDFVKREVTLCVAFVAALISCFFVTPDKEYFGYIDLRTLALLFCLMVVVAGLRGAGVFSALAHRMCEQAGSLRTICMLMVGLCFFSSMLITNDVALLTFVPFAIVVLGMAHRSGELVRVVILQTVAANLGSILTPVGNPQNLYLYSAYQMSIADFFAATAPVWLVSLLLIAVACFFFPRTKIDVFLGEKPDMNRRSLAVYALLFGVCMLVVFRVIDWPWMLLTVTAVLAFYDRRILLQADFMLLLTFVCFFVFAGNLTRIDAVRGFFGGILSGHELIAGAAVSQLISNVPAALLLSGFTENGRALLLGVDIGGLGTPIASLASLISLKLYMHAEDADAKKFLAGFTLVNVLFLAVLLAVGLLLI